MREKCVATRLKIPISTFGAILKKFKANGTVTNLPGRGHMFILSTHTARRIREAKKSEFEPHTFKVVD